MYNLNWSRKELTSQKLGTFCEYYAKMSLASYGMSIYTSEVDDHGIDFIAESRKGFLKFQVKAIRQGTGYVFMRKEHFDISDPSLYLMLLLLRDGEHPAVYLVPATTWSHDNSNIFVYHSYEGKKSKPEYGINLSARNIPLMEPFKLEHMIGEIDQDLRRKVLAGDIKEEDRPVEASMGSEPLNRPRAIIFTGIQASGKSTFFRQHFPAGFVHINLDTLHTRNKEADLLNECLENGTSFVVDNTNPTANDRKRYIQAAKEHGYFVEGYFFQSVVKDCVARNLKREGKACVPAKAIACTSNRLELPSYGEGFDRLYFVRIQDDTFCVDEWNVEREDEG